MALSKITGTGNGTAPVVNLTFPFLDKAHIQATANNVPVAFTWTGASQITFSAAVNAGQPWAVFRNSSINAALVDFTNGAVLTEADLDKANLQHLYLEQELSDDLADAISGGAPIIPDGNYGDITVTSGIWTINGGAVVFGKMADVASGSLFYRKTAGPGSPEVQDLSILKADLGLTGTNSGDQTITLTGDVGGTGTGSFVTTIAAGAVSYAKMQNVSATGRFLGRFSAGAGVPEEVTGTQATTLLDTFTSALKGLAPASGGGTANFLRADGTWAAPPGGAGGGTTTNAVTFNVTGGAAAGTTFDGSVARIIDYSTVGAAKAGAVTASGLTASTGVILGRVTAATGAIEELTPNATLTLSAGAIGVAHTPTAATFTNAGGAAAGATFDGSTAITVSASTLGAALAGALTASGLTVSTGVLAGRTTAATGALEEITPAATLSLAAGVLGVASTPQAVTFNTTGGAASGSSFNGSAARTVDYSTVGAAPKNPQIQSVASSATVTPTFSNDQVNITAQAAALTLANPTGTAVDGWRIVIRIKDNGTARTIAYGTQYRAIGVTLPTTTVISKTLYLGLKYNSADTKWDVLAVAQE